MLLFALIVLTEWDEFRAVDLEKVRNLMKGYVIFDGRNIFNPKILRPTANTIEGIKNAVIPNQSLIHRLAIYAPTPPIVLLIFLSVIISPRFFPETILSSAFQSKKKEIKAISK